MNVTFTPYDSLLCLRPKNLSALNDAWLPCAAILNQTIAARHVSYAHVLHVVHSACAYMPALHINELFSLKCVLWTKQIFSVKQLYNEVEYLFT